MYESPDAARDEIGLRIQSLRNKAAAAHENAATLRSRADEDTADAERYERLADDYAGILQRESEQAFRASLPPRTGKRPER